MLKEGQVMAIGYTLTFCYKGNNGRSHLSIPTPALVLTYKRLTTYIYRSTIRIDNNVEIYHQVTKGIVRDV